ncbi:hypothetical protein CEXT_444561 [Caerostris extrusa]|uniref:Uncharacterized protein n=1 Tax=Caerostris extrusa TaxID=172846 RepID=A0AAV4QBC4_CAEEX|nr:hypothetical protein CEXT_444561 [Caerostris extrusa]
MTSQPSSSSLTQQLHAVVVKCQMVKWSNGQNDFEVKDYGMGSKHAKASKTGGWRELALEDVVDPLNVFLGNVWKNYLKNGCHIIAFWGFYPDKAAGA